MKLKIIYPVFKIVFSILSLCLFNFQSKAGVMLDTTSLEWNQEVNKCVNLLNGAIERNKNIEDSILADDHFNFNRLNTTFDAEGNLKKSDDAVSYQYVTDRNSFDFISEQAKINLNEKLKALKDIAGVSYYILFHPSDYKMTPFEAASFNNKVFGRSNLGNSTTNKGILILVSVHQIKSVNNFFGYRPVVSTNCQISLSTGSSINPEVKNEFADIVNSVFRGAYEESLRDQKYLGVFDAIYRKINFSRKVYAYQVDEKGDIKEEIVTLQAKMGNNEAITLTLHVRTPFYVAGYQNDLRYYKQINPIREIYIKQYARAFVRLITASNFPGAYSNQYLSPLPGYALKDEYIYKWSWSVAIDVAGIMVSCVGQDLIVDFAGAVYYASQGEWVVAAIYTGAMFVPFVSGSIIRAFLAAGRTFSRAASFLIGKTASITNEVSATIWKFYTTSTKTKVFAEINTNGDLFIKEFSTVNFTGSTNDIVRSAQYTNPTGHIEIADIAFTNVNGISGVTKMLMNVIDNIFDLSTFKNITARIPTGSKLTNIKKTEFLAYGYKVKPTNGALKTKIDDIIANGDYLGAKTEGVVDDIMSSNGYIKLDGKYGSNNGYDGIYIKGTVTNPTEIIIIESKQFKYTNGVADDILEYSGITLNSPSATTPLPAQMSDAWVQYVQNKMRGEGKTAVANMIRDFDDKITKYVTAVDKIQGEINFLKLGAY